MTWPAWWWGYHISLSNSKKKDKPQGQHCILKIQFPLVQKPFEGETAFKQKMAESVKHRACGMDDTTCLLYTGAHRCRRHTGELSKVKLLKEGAEVCARQVRQHSWENRTENQSLQKIISFKGATIQRVPGSLENMIKRKCWSNFDYFAYFLSLQPSNYPPHFVTKENDLVGLNIFYDIINVFQHVMMTMTTTWIKT